MKIVIDQKVIAFNAEISLVSGTTLKYRILVLCSIVTRQASWLMFQTRKLALAPLDEAIFNFSNDRNTLFRRLDADFRAICWPSRDVKFKLHQNGTTSLQFFTTRLIQHYALTSSHVWIFRVLVLLKLNKISSIYFYQLALLPGRADSFILDWKFSLSLFPVTIVLSRN